MTYKNQSIYLLLFLAACLGNGISANPTHLADCLNAIEDLNPNYLNNVIDPIHDPDEIKKLFEELNEVEKRCKALLPEFQPECYNRRTMRTIEKMLWDKLRASRSQQKGL